MKKFFIKNITSSKKIFAALLLFFLPAQMLYSESIFDPSQKADFAVYSNFELDSAPLLSFGYISKTFFSFFKIDANIGIPTGRIFNAPWAGRYSILSSFPILEKGGFKINNFSGFKGYAQQSPYWNGLSIHLYEKIQSGYFKEKWFSALELGFSPILSTYISHKDFVKEMNPEISDGWYGKFVEGVYFIGISAGLKIADLATAAFRYHYALPIEKSKYPVQRSLLDGKIALGCYLNF